MYYRFYPRSFMTITLFIRGEKRARTMSINVISPFSGHIPIQSHHEDRYTDLDGRYDIIFSTAKPFKPGRVGTPPIPLFGSRPSDHYFRSVCLSVCLFFCAEFFSAVFDPILIKLGHNMLCVWVQLCPLEYRGCATPGGQATPRNLYFQGFWGSKNYLVLQF